MCIRRKVDNFIEKIDEIFKEYNKYVMEKI